LTSDVCAEGKRARIMRHRVLHPGGETMGVGFDANGQRKGESGTQVEAGQEDNEKALCMPLAALLVAVIWAFIVTTQCAVDSLSKITVEHPSFRKEWVALVLLPIASKAADLYSAIKVASKSELEHCLDDVFRSSLKVALLVIPLMDMIAWIAGEPPFMFFNPIDSGILLVVVVTTTPQVQFQMSNWLVGMTLVCFYVLSIICSWLYSESRDEN